MKTATNIINKMSNGDGEMSYKEGIEGGADPKMVALFFATHDLDNSTTANAKELAKFLWFYDAVTSNNPNAVLKALWSVVGGDGYATVDEIHKIGIWNKAEVEAFFKKADESKDGRVSYQELSRRLHLDAAE